MRRVGEPSAAAIEAAASCYQSVTRHAAERMLRAAYAVDVIHAKNPLMPHDRRLKIDVDNWRQALPLGEILRRLRFAGYRLRSYCQERSPSGRGLHVWVTVTSLPQTPTELVALQLLLGSDPLREAHNLERARAVEHGRVSQWWADRFNVFYSRSTG